MNIAGSVALVTGANRGLGKAYVEALLSSGAAKVYAGARDPSKITDSRVIRYNSMSVQGVRSILR